MIRVLAREQWRFQRMYIVWAAAIVAAAVGFATVATLSAATQGAIDQYSSRILLDSAPRNAVVVFTDSDFDAPESVTDWGVPMTSVALSTIIAAAESDGAGPVAHVAVWGDIVPETGWSTDSAYPDSPTIYAVWGDVDWMSILAEGTAPGPDDIVLPAAAARERHVGIGDSVMLGHTVSDDPDTWEFVPDTTLTVSGLAYDISRYGSGGPAYVAREQLDAIAAIWTGGTVDGEPSPLQAHVGWQRPSPALAQLGDPWEGPQKRTFGSTDALPWLLAALFTAGAVVTAFTLGRAQAQSRVRWVATARALGARRTHLVGIALWEWAAVGLMGAIAGVTTGWVAALLAHARRMDHLAAPPPVELSTPIFVLGLMLALSAVLAAAVVAVPTLFALRVQPTAALKDTAVADAVIMSRKVRFWPVGVAFAGLWAAAIATNHINTEATWPWIPILIIGSGLLAIPVIVEACRALTQATARALAKSRRPWAVHASMTMEGHPQQVAALAIVQALLVTGLAGWTAAGEPGNSSFAWVEYSQWTPAVWVSMLEGYLQPALRDPVTSRMVLVLVAATQVLVIAIAASAARVAGAETATAGALGLPRRAAVTGDAVAWWLAQAHGAWVGAGMGLIGVGGIWLAAWTSVNEPTSEAVDTFPQKAVAVAVVTLLSLALAGAVAATSAVAISARRLRTRAAVARASTN